MNLYEKETIITYNQKEETADVYTHDPQLIKKLSKLALKQTDKVFCTHKYADGAVCYIVPKSCVTVREPVSQKQRQAAKDRAIRCRIQPPKRDVHT